MNRRSNQAPRRYERKGLLAIEPKAFFEFFMVPESRDNEDIEGVTIVDICGPLDQHDDGWCDSYDAIKRRVQDACAVAGTRAIVLRIDSPGGDVAGCFDTARDLRTLCKAAGKSLYAYVDGKACSAGYALACSAGMVALSDTGIVGSVGVISTREDVSAMNAAHGLRVAFITSGARKADGHPDAPITEAEIKETQIVVDSMAGVFFELVAEMRGTDAAAVGALEARVFHGDAAIKAGLADVVQSFDSLLAIASEGKAMATSYEKARDALVDAAKGDDANAAAAKRALAAMEPPAEEGDDDEKKKKDEEAAAAAAATAAAEGGDDDEKKKADVEAAAAATAAAAKGDVALQALAEVHKLRAEGVAKELAAERTQLLASRPDFGPELRAALQTAPMKNVREMVKTLPKGPMPKPAAAATVTGTRGAGQGAGGPHSDPDLRSEDTQALDRAFGMSALVPGVRREGNHSMVLGFFPAEPKPPAASSGTAGGAK